MADIFLFFCTNCPGFSRTFVPTFNPSATVETDKHSHTHINLGVIRPKQLLCQIRYNDETDSIQFVRSRLDDFSWLFNDSKYQDYVM